MVADGTIVPDWICGVDLHGEFALSEIRTRSLSLLEPDTNRRHDATVNAGLRGAWRVEWALSDIVTAVELEGDDVSNGSSDGAWREGILSTLADLDGERGCNGARDESKKRESVDHFECLYKDRMRRFELITIVYGIKK